MPMPTMEFSDEDRDKIRKLAEIQCTQKEIAHVMGVSQSSLKKYNIDVLNEGKNLGKVKLRRAQYNKAVEEGNPTMLIWLGKQMLGQADMPMSTEDNLILPWEGYVIEGEEGDINDETTDN